MASRTGTFSAINSVSLDLALAPGESLNVVLTRTGADAFGVALDERATGTTYSPVVAYAADTAGTVYVNATRFPRHFRLRCAALVGADTIAYTLADVAGESLGGLYPLRNADGVAVFDVSDDGIESPLVTATVGTFTTMNATTAAVTGALTLSEAASVGAVAGASAVATSIPGVFMTTIAFTARALAVTDALAYAGTKVFDFPEGRIYILGAIGSLRFGISTDPTTTINASADLDWSLGTVTASSITLASTMVDLIPKVDAPLAAAQTTLNTATAGTLAAAAFFDGTVTPVDAFLNVSFPTNTQIDADGTLAVTGTISLLWGRVGDV